MTVLHVTEQGARILLSNDAIEIRKGKERLGRVPLDELEQVSLSGRIEITSAALHALLRRGVSLDLMSRAGAWAGRLAPAVGRNIGLRRRQFAVLEEEDAKLMFAKAIVRGKIANSRTLLTRYQRRRKDEGLARALVSMRRARDRLEGANTLDKVRGFEGTAAAAYFGCFDILLTAPGVTFPGRKRRPPPDPVNILLSFGYTLLLSLVQGLIEQAGMDPYLGALHAPEYGRPSLALDLMEEFRSVVVDAAVLDVINHRKITPQDFTPVEDGDAPVEEEWEREDGAENEARPKRRLIMHQDASRRWLAAFHHRLSARTWYPPRQQRLSYRQVVREQIYSFARALEDGDYAPFPYRP